jgi:hypothetical protein
MIEVSNDFKKAVYAPSRATHAQVRFEILDTTAFKDNTITINDEEVFSKYTQLTNKIRVPSLKIGTFEKDYFKLDGTFCLPPVSTNNLELGYWSENLCDENRVFNNPEQIIFTFSKEHSSIGLTIYFDVLNNECAEQFNIYFYDINNQLFKTINVVDNNNSIYECIEQLDNYGKIMIDIVKWCKPYRRVKIVEVDFGIIRTYTDKNLIRMSLVQQLDIISGTLPSDEMKFTVDNSSSLFNILNPQGYTKYIQKGQEAFLLLGVELDEDTEIYEDVNVGKYFITTQQSDEGTLTTTFTARDIFELLSNDEIENSTVNEMTLYDFAVQIFNSCGIESYTISDSLKLINTKCLYQKMTYRSLIQLIAIAGMCVIFSNNNGGIVLEQLTDAINVLSGIDVPNTEIIGSKDDIMDNIMTPDYKYATFEKDFFKLDGSFYLPTKNSSIEKGWLSTSLSSEDGTFSEPLVITINLSKEQTGNNLEIAFDTLNNEYATDFTINAYDANNQSLLSEIISNNSNSLFHYVNNSLVGAIKIVVTLNKWCIGYRRARIFEIGFNLPVDYISFANMYAEPQITTNDIIKTVKVKYYPTDLNNPIEYIYTDDTIKSGSIMELDNSLVNTEVDAINIAKWIIRENNNGANTFKLNWRGNPALELADKVTVQNGYNSKNVINITKNELDYEGYLSGKLEGRGMS